MRRHFWGPKLFFRDIFLLSVTWISYLILVLQFVYMGFLRYIPLIFWVFIFAFRWADETIHRLTIISHAALRNLNGFSEYCPFMQLKFLIVSNNFLNIEFFLDESWLSLTLRWVLFFSKWVHTNCIRLWLCFFSLLQNHLLNTKEIAFVILNVRFTDERLQAIALIWFFLVGLI